MAEELQGKRQKSKQGPGVSHSISIVQDMQL